MSIRNLINSVFGSGESSRPRGTEHGLPLAASKSRLALINSLHRLDPQAPDTESIFSNVMEEVLRDRSVREGHDIANRPTPVPPHALPGAQGNPDFQALMLELATIRRFIKIQGAAGIIEEERLTLAFDQWTQIARSLRTQPARSSHMTKLSEEYRRAVLILDSIERRKPETLTRAILRFRHLYRQLGIGSS